jgi:Fimbrial assembly protein (PilN).
MTRINLLPPEERSRAAREQGLLLAIVGLVVLVVALGAVYFMSYRQVSDKKVQLDTISGQVDVANVQLAALKPYAALQVQRQAMDVTAAQILNSRVIMSNVLEEVGLLIPSGVSLTQMNVTVPAYMVAGSTDASALGVTTALGTDLTLVGDATGSTLYDAHVQVATLMTQLGLMPQIMNIRLTSANASSTELSKPDVQFSIAANLRPFATTPPLAPAAPSITMGGGQ